MRWNILLLALFLYGSGAQQCPVDIPDAERRDCHPWANASQASCEARGCVWCEAGTGFPWCFYNDKVCPSLVAEGDRVDCMPEGGGKDDCHRKGGCVWCETATPSIPFCFFDADSSLGGDFCPVDIPESERVDCHPDPATDLQTVCLQRGCFYCPSATPDVPFCFMPKQAGYRMLGAPVQTPVGWTVTLERVNTPSMFGQDVQQLTLDVEYHTDDRLKIKFYDAANARFEVPLTIPAPGTPPSNPQYDVTFLSDPVFGFQVTRVSTGAVIFDTTIGGLQFADQYISFGTRLNSDRLYGFGEHEHPNFRHDMNWKSWSMWTRDAAVDADINLYGSQPFYVNVEQSSDVHGVLILNANAQDITMQPAPALTYRTIGGVLDMYVFMGPSPDGVVQQYLSAVGYPVMPPYWSLGFQLCRWGYTDLDHMKDAVNRMRQYDIPHDIQYGDIDYMLDYKIFTIDPVNFAGLPEYVDQLKAEGTRYITILDPGVYNQDPPGTYPTFDNGNSLDVWVRDPTGQAPQEGEVWPGLVYYPDYSRPSTETWWTNELVDFKTQLDFAGLWIDMNEPSSFIHGSAEGCSDNRWNFPPYVPRILDGIMYQKTICMDTVTDLGISYNAHSLYGWGMAQQTLPAVRAAMPGLRSIVYSRSTFPGAGQWGQHWLGDNFSHWNNLVFSLIGMFEFNMFGMPYVGADICGFIDVTTEELCRRWQVVGAFYPFSRNHNADGNPDQDPGMWPTVASDTRTALLIRYRLLPYLYTLFHRSHTSGSTVIRPLMFEFTSDVTTHDVDAQFLWGPAFLVSPAMAQGVNTVTAYLPDARWFDYFTGAEEPTRGGFTDFPTPLGAINLHIRGGHVLPVQQPANSTMFSRSLPMGLLVALDDAGAASGELFWDDGDSLDTFENGLYFEASYSVSAGAVTATVVNDGYAEIGNLVMDDFVIMGTGTITAVTINGGVFSDWTQDPTTQQITIQNAGVTVNTAFTVAWS